MVPEIAGQSCAGAEAWEMLERNESDWRCFGVVSGAHSVCLLGQEPSGRGTEVSVGGCRVLMVGPVKLHRGLGRQNPVAHVNFFGVDADVDVAEAGGGTADGVAGAGGLGFLDVAEAGGGTRDARACDCDKANLWRSVRLGQDEMDADEVCEERVVYFYCPHTRSADACITQGGTGGGAAAGAGQQPPRDTGGGAGGGVEQGGWCGCYARVQAEVPGLLPVCAGGQ